MNSESTSQQTGENIEIINDFELRIGCRMYQRFFLITGTWAILEPFVLNYMTSNWDKEKSKLFVI